MLKTTQLTLLGVMMVFLLAGFTPPAFYPNIVQAQQTALKISQIATNAADYTAGQIPQYAKFELTFQVENTVAGNFQLPYDPHPPNGLNLTNPKHQGISVDALFLPPGQTDWDQAYQQPAFFYQHFDRQIKKDANGANREWAYPTGQFSWKVRFSPNQPGEWQFKLKAQDASGYTETTPQSFAVINSSNQGFIRVSSTDPRYFEFDNGAPFHGLGFAYTANLADPVLRTEPDFQTYQQNGINLLRVWISSLYGSAWLNYLGGRNMYDGYLPRTALLPFLDPSINQAHLAMLLDYEPGGDTGWFDACRFEFWDNPEAVKPNTNYRLRIRYRGFNISGPRNAAFPPYGLVGKLGGWHANCYEPNTGVVVTNYGLNNTDWQFLEGVWNSGNNNFLPRLHLGLENVNQGQVYVDAISLQEVLGNGQYGPELMAEPSLEYELYVPQESAYALDKVVELAEQQHLYLKLVLMEKEDNIYFKMQDNGDFVLEGPDNLDGFYGLGRTLNKTRWLQQAWWRMLQARWGYSPSIHSWELTNEGDPANNNHHALTDELGKYMHCRVFNIPVASGNGQKCAYNHPNDHMVTTSFWHSFPAQQVWANPNYPNIDYADVHAYVSTGWQHQAAHQDDSAEFHLDYSAEVRNTLDEYAAQNNLLTKPVIRGETGLDFVNQQTEQPDLARDTRGVWLHTLLWSTLDAGAMTELYWWGDNTKNQPGPDGQPGLYEIYATFYNFVGDIPLNNGAYQDIEARVNNSNLRVVGQKDLVRQNAHLWIQNKQYTWRNVVDNVPIPNVSGTVTISGFKSNQDYIVQWWNITTDKTNQPQSPVRIETITTSSNGDINLNVTDLTEDTAVKIFKERANSYLPLILREMPCCS